jgi:zinc and cadmium transporter
MAEVWVLTLASVLVVSVLGFVGVVMLTAKRLRSHILLIFVIAVAAGTLIGDALFHLLPEAVEARGAFVSEISLFVVAGFLVFYMFEAALRWRHAHAEAAHTHDAEHETHHASNPAERPKPFGWLNLASDGLHNFVDGGIIAATYLVDPRLGLATTVAVAIHEVPTEFGDFGVLLSAGIQPRKALLYNFVSALTALAGALFILLVPASSEAMGTYGVPLIAGGFLYIAAADLVPELHHHTGPRYVVLTTVGLILGLAAMYAFLFMEA